MNIPRRLWIALFLLVAIAALGTVGYVLIENWSPLDAFYMTVITISTVGFRELAPLSFSGRIFTLSLIVLGVGAVIYTLSNLIEFFVEEHLTGLIGRRKMEKQIQALKDHYIICGYGRVGKEIVEELAQAGTSFVVIDNNEGAVKKCREEELLYIMGNASDDQVLRAAGVEKAQGLVAVVDSDAENIFITLSARVLNPNIFVIARAELEETEEKLKKAGADRVISPAVIGGKKIAALLLRPMVCDYLDVVCSSEDTQFQLRELKIREDSSFANRSLKDAAIREKTGALILAIRTTKGELNSVPSSSTIIMEGDRLIVMGTKKQFDALQALM